MVQQVRNRLLSPLMNLYKGKVKIVATSEEEETQEAAPAVTEETAETAEAVTEETNDRK